MDSYIGPTRTTDARTEEEKLLQQGAPVQLGEKEYRIKPLTLRKSLAWRTHAAPLVSTILAKENALENPDSLRVAILESPQQIADAVFKYLECSTEEQETILDSASEDQLMMAFFLIMGICFRPLTYQRKLAEWMRTPELPLESKSQPASGVPSTLQ